MMKPISIYFISFVILLFTESCSKPKSELLSRFSCDKNIEIHNLESVSDFNNNFSIKVPKHWNTKLYYDNIQSEIFSADTLKNLSDTYIMDFSAVYSDLKIDSELKEKVKQKTVNNDLKFIKDSFHKFQGMDAYAHLSRGISKDLTLYVFQYYIRINDAKYMLIKTEFYGEDNFKQRFCEALSLINKIDINK